MGRGFEIDVAGVTILPATEYHVSTTAGLVGYLLAHLVECATLGAGKLTGMGSNPAGSNTLICYNLRAHL